MLHRSRRDWEALASRLACEGIGALAFDLRGHGESPGLGRRRPSRRWSADVKAARRFLATRSDVVRARRHRSAPRSGANLAALAAADDPTVASLALLSPSLDYRGLRIEPAMRKIGARPVLLVASDDDAYATRIGARPAEGRQAAARVCILSGAGHGTVMLDRDPTSPARWWTGFGGRCYDP